MIVDESTGRVMPDRSVRSYAGCHQLIEQRRAARQPAARTLAACLQRLSGDYLRLAGMTGTGEGGRAESLRCTGSMSCAGPAAPPSGDRTARRAIALR